VTVIGGRYGEIGSIMPLRGKNRLLPTSFNKRSGNVPNNLIDWSRARRIIVEGTRGGWGWRAFEELGATTKGPDQKKNIRKGQGRRVVATTRIQTDKTKRGGEKKVGKHYQCARNIREGCFVKFRKGKKVRRGKGG